MPPSVHRLPPDSLAPYLDDIERIYRQAFAANGATSRRFRQRLVQESQTLAGFRFFLAEDEHGVAGFIYGYHLEPTNWWPTMIRPVMLVAGLDDWLDDAFELVEFAVDPERQQQGTGGRLYAALIATVTEPRVLLGTDPPPTIAHHFYTHRGWTTLIPEWRHSPDDADYHLIMGLDLRRQ